MSNTQLMELFSFDESDLNANRQGRLTPKQKTRLDSNEKRSKGCGFILGLLLAGIGLIGIAIALTGGLAMYKEDRFAGAVFMAGFGLIWPLIWCGLGFSSIRRAYAKVEIKVKSAEGPVNIVKVVRDTYNSTTETYSEEEAYELHIGQKTFEVHSSLADIMMQGDMYAVYYADYNLEDIDDEILSVEILKQR